MPLSYATVTALTWTRSRGSLLLRRIAQEASEGGFRWLPRKSCCRRVNTVLGRIKSLSRWNLAGDALSGGP